MADDRPSAEGALDLFGEARASLPTTTRRVIDAGGAIMQDAPDRADFLHAILCQVGMPRKSTSGRVFERSSGGAGMLLEVKHVYNCQN